MCTRAGCVCVSVCVSVKSVYIFIVVTTSSFFLAKRKNSENDRASLTAEVFFVSMHRVPLAGKVQTIYAIDHSNTYRSCSLKCSEPSSDLLLIYT